MQRVFSLHLPWNTCASWVHSSVPELIHSIGGRMDACGSLPGCRFVASLALHEGALVANYPFDGYEDGSRQERHVPHPSPDDATFRSIATAYAKAHTTMTLNNSVRRELYRRADCIGFTSRGGAGVPDPGFEVTSCQLFPLGW